MFLHPGDYKSQIRDDVKDVVSGSNDLTLTSAELKAQAQMETYLNHRYVLSDIFISSPEYDNAKTYSEGDQVYYENPTGVYKTYIAKSGTTGNAPTDDTYWEEGDNRDQHIVDLMVSITLYKLHRSNNPAAMPDHVQKEYDEALNWLEKVAASKLNPGLPLISEDTGNPVKAGSITQQKHYW